MAILKCKMCGGQLEIVDESGICTCEYCGAQQTIPKVTDENIQSLFNRANVLRMKAEFDKATDIYEKILQSNGTEAEAYWGLILCKYGIEYVEDPVTYKRVPTCHRASFDAVTADDDYKMALQYADSIQKSVYEQEAKQIDEIQKGIVELAQKEAPYDVFICYKETDENGDRTQDSVIANDVYYQLSQEGYKVFYAAITLEDKLGQEYEPYIFSALNSARVMLVIGTKPEYFNTVWVKNEWSRFLKIMKKDRARMLIPCYRDMDAYELPEEFAHLQAQDMSKIGFINDIVRGIKKVIKKESEEKAQIKETVVVQQHASGNNYALLKRGNMALEDGEWQKADDFFEEVLNHDAECAEAYLGKWLAKIKVYNIDKLANYYLKDYENVEGERVTAIQENEDHIQEVINQYCIQDYLERDSIKKMYAFDRSYLSYVKGYELKKQGILNTIYSEKLYSRTTQYANDDFANKLNKILEEINEALDLKISNAKKTDEECINRIQHNYKEYFDEVDINIKDQYDNAVLRREGDYQKCIDEFNKADKIEDYQSVKTSLKKLSGYKSVNIYIEKCDIEISRIIEKEKIERERIDRKDARTKKIIIGVIVIVITLGVICIFVLIDNNKKSKYREAQAYIEKGQYTEAENILINLDYKNSENLLNECRYGQAIELKNTGKYSEAIEILEELGNYSDSAKQIKYVNYELGLYRLEKKNYSGALKCFENSDGEDYLKYCDYCRLGVDINNIKEGTNLTSLYVRVKKLKNFNNADILVTENKYLNQITKMIGKWEHTYTYTKDKAIIEITDDGRIKYSLYIGGKESSSDTTDIFAYESGYICAPYTFYYYDGKKFDWDERITYDEKKKSITWNDKIYLKK